MSPDPDRTAGSSRATAVDDPTKSVGFATSRTARITNRSSCRQACPRRWRPPRGSPPQTPIHWANATHACACEVDVTTGEGDLTRYRRQRGRRPDDQSQRRRRPDRGWRDRCGGIGGALLESLVCDDDANPLATTFVDYLLPTAPPRCRPSNTVTSRCPGRCRRLQGLPAGRGDRIDAGGHQRDPTTLAPLGVTVTRLPATGCDRGADQEASAEPR